MRVHWLQHAAEDDLGCIAPYLAARGIEATVTRWYLGETAPPLADVDVLLVMGGAMNVDQHDRHPWLIEEKRFLRAVLATDRRVLGICLGAQLIAECLGATVGRNAEPEIGWHDVTLTTQGRQLDALADWPSTLAMFHWHGDTFDLPAGAVPLASSAACALQGFALRGDRVLGLQFHPEVTSASVRVWLEHEAPEPGRFVQTGAEMRAQLQRFALSNSRLCGLLDRWLPR